MMIISGVHGIVRYKSYKTETISFHLKVTGFGLRPAESRFRGILRLNEEITLTLAFSASQPARAPVSSSMVRGLVGKRGREELHVCWNLLILN